MIIIFRHQLFKVSEPFITEQVGSCTKTEFNFLGKTLLGPVPPGARYLTLDQLPEERKPWRRLWQAVTRDPQPYLRVLEGKNPTLIHAHFGVEGVYAMRLAKRLHIPLIVTFHGFDATRSAVSLLASGSPSWINYVIFRRSLRRSGAIFICVSKFIQDKVVALGFPREKTLVHYMGIDLAKIRLRNDDEETPMVLHVARLVEKKGTRFLIEAFSSVVRSGNLTAELTIIGEGPEQGALQMLCAKLEISDRVRFLGAVPNHAVLAHMRKAAMLVIPSVTAESGDSEGLGMVTLEAAALGVPVIGTRHGGIPEAIEDGYSGYLVTERDTVMLAERISKLLNSQELRRNLGQNARTLMESKFDIRKQSALLESIYKTVGQ